MKTAITAKQATACLLDGEKIEVAVQTKTNYKIELWEREQAINALRTAQKIYVSDEVERLNGFGLTVPANENNITFDFLFISTDNNELLLTEQQIAQEQQAE